MVAKGLCFVVMVEGVDLQCSDDCHGYERIFYEI